jgi:hypothetical protein
MGYPGDPWEFPYYQTNGKPLNLRIITSRPPTKPQEQAEKEVKMK